MRRSSASTAGFTLVEILVAIVVLGIGVVALLGSSAMVTRMLGEGKHTTVAVTYAERRLEVLRRIARSTTPPCSDAKLAGGATLDTTWAASVGVTEHVRVTALSQGVLVRDSVVYATPRGSGIVTLRTVISCL